MSKPLPIDERRVAAAADACDDHEAYAPRGPGWKEERTRLYRVLKEACELAAKNAT